jgi:hypothetical protein
LQKSAAAAAAVLLFLLCSQNHWFIKPSYPMSGTMIYTGISHTTTKRTPKKKEGVFCV